MKSKQIKRQRTTRKSVGARLVSALTELRDTLKSGTPLHEKLTVRTVHAPAEPARYDANAVVATRRRLGASQAIFAQLVGVSTVLEQSWEQGVRAPSKLARRLLDEINRDPEHWRSKIEPRTEVDAA